MTVLTKVTLNESVELDFGLEISGTHSKDMEIRFIIEGPDYDISCRCVESSGIITANIPRLAGILQPGTYAATLEVIVDGKHFQPLSENIEFVVPMTVGVSPKLAIRSETINIRANAIGAQSISPVIFEKPTIIPRRETLVTPSKRERLEEMAARIREYEEMLAKVRKK